MHARGWHQRGNLVDQFERGQHQGAGSVRARLGDVVAQMFGVVLVQMIEGERRAGAVAQQPFPTRPVGAFDAHRGVEREAAAVRPAAHPVSSILLEQAATDEGAQHPVQPKTDPQAKRFSLTGAKTSQGGHRG